MPGERSALAEWEGHRGTFSAVFVRLGEKRHGLGPRCVPLFLGHTVLLHSVCDAAGNVVADHVWLDQTRQWRALDLRPGDTVQFRARVKTYYKGYEGLTDEPLKHDFKFVDLRAIVVIRALNGGGGTEGG